MTSSASGDATERMRLQPTVNIGLCGHVSHGKTSFIKWVTGEHTSRGDSRAVKNNITVQVGYSNAKIYRCRNCEPPACYAGCEGSCKAVPPCPTCAEKQNNMSLVAHVSFVDCPGHQALMRNMISGSAVMDGVFLVIAVNDPCPMAQTAEHLIAADICGIERFVVLQNKVDLLLMKDGNDPSTDEGRKESRAELHENRKAIEEFIAGTSAENAPIVPASFSPARPLNVDVVLQYIATKFSQSELAQPCYRPFSLVMHCVRSFNINKPGTEVFVEKAGAKRESTLKGGVIGGTIMNGTLRVGEDIEIRPGLIRQDAKSGKLTATPLRTRVVGLMTGTTRLEEASRGGLIAVATTLDPTLTRSDRMVGMCIGRVGELPESTQTLVVTVKLLKWALGMAPEEEKDEEKKKEENDDDDGDGGEEEEKGQGEEEEQEEKKKKKGNCLKREKVVPVQKGEVLQISVGSGSEKAKVVEQKDVKNVFRLQLAKPVCAIPGQKMTLSRSIDGAFRIIGQAQLFQQK